MAEAVKRFNGVKVGLPLDPETKMSCQISKRQVEKILFHVKISVEEGEKVLCGGEAATDGKLSKGCFLRPTLPDDVTRHARGLGRHLRLRGLHHQVQD